MRIRFTARALQDLDDLKKWLHLRNPQGLRSVRKRLSDALKLLPRHPQIGRKTIRKDIFELVEPRYGFIIPYTVKEESIFILRVYSARREPLDPTSLPDPTLDREQ